MQCQCVMEFGKPLLNCDRPEPEPTGHEVVVQLEAAGICHSDVHMWEGYFDLGDGQRLVEHGIKMPVVMGHENVGKVVKTGADVKTEFDADKNYIVFSWIGCGSSSCPVCQSGQENLCPAPRTLGVQIAGGYAQYMLVPHERYLIDIGDLDPVVAAPFACSGLTTYSALQKIGADVYKNYPIVIMGAGGLGLMAIQILQALGGVGAVVTDIDPAKRSAALEAGALAAIDSRAPDAVQQIHKALQSVAAPDKNKTRGARGVLDLVGASDTVKLAVDSVDKGGRIVVVGLFGGSVNLSTVLLPLQEISLRGSYVGNLQEFTELMALARNGKIKPLPITRVTFDDIPTSLEKLRQGEVIGRQIVDFAM